MELMVEGDFRWKRRDFPARLNFSLNRRAFFHAFEPETKKNQIVEHIILSIKAWFWAKNIHAQRPQTCNCHFNAIKFDFLPTTWWPIFHLIFHDFLSFVFYVLLSMSSHIVFFLLFLNYRVEHTALTFPCMLEPSRPLQLVFQDICVSVQKRPILKDVSGIVR